MRTYYMLTKPGIIMGNLITTIGGFALASKGGFNFFLFFQMLLGLGCIIASACVCNNCIDRLSDQKMERTKNRPLAQGVISVQQALVFAAVLGGIGLFLLAFYTNALSVFTASAGFLIYVLGYSLSKHYTSAATLIGSLSGAAPPVVGYTVAAQTFDLGALLLFLILILWQMPHFYSIALFRFKDYQLASIPVLPIVRGVYVTKVHIIGYIIAFIATTSLLTVFGYTGYLYLFVASILGCSWLWLGRKGFHARCDEKWGRQMFFLSLVIITTLSGLFLYGEEFDVAVIGGGPAGLSAAIYSSRAGMKTVVIQGEEIGGQITQSALVENYPGFAAGISGADLSSQMEKQAANFGAKLLPEVATMVDLSKRPFRLQMGPGKEVIANTIIIATGAKTRWLGLPSETYLKGKGVNSCAICDGFLYRDKEVVVVGGGDAAIEDALYLANLASKVTVIHRRDKLRATQKAQTLAFENKKISFVFDAVVEEILDVQKEEVVGVRIKNVHTGKESIVPCDGVFIAIGHIPSSELFQQSLPLTKEGYILTKPGSTQTKIPGVFACGDVADPIYRQAVVAAGFGAMAAIEAFQFLGEGGSSTRLSKF